MFSNLTLLTVVLSSAAVAAPMPNVVWLSSGGTPVLRAVKRRACVFDANRAVATGLDDVIRLTSCPRPVKETYCGISNRALPRSYVPASISTATGWLAEAPLMPATAAISAAPFSAGVPSAETNIVFFIVRAARSA